MIAGAAATLIVLVILAVAGASWIGWMIKSPEDI